MAIQSLLTRARRRHPALALLGALYLSSCSDGDGSDEGADGRSGGGGSGDRDGSTNGGGTVTEEWVDFCTGVFTKDTPIRDHFDDLLFTAKPGEEYLLADFSDSFGGRAQFVYLTSGGPDTFNVDLEDVGTWPFTTNCDIGTGVPYYAAFTDIQVFAEAELTTKICDIAKGTFLPSEGAEQGYSLSGDAVWSGSQLYEVYLGPFSAQCGGATSGFISVPETRSFGSGTWLVPLVGIIGPK